MSDEDRPALIVGASIILGLVLFGIILSGAIKAAGDSIGEGACKSGASAELGGVLAHQC